MRHDELYEYLKNNGWLIYSKKAVKMLEDKGYFEISSYDSLLDNELAINRLGYKTEHTFRIDPREDRFAYKGYVKVWQ